MLLEIDPGWTESLTNQNMFGGGRRKVVYSIFTFLWHVDNQSGKGRSSSHRFSPFPGTKKEQAGRGGGGSSMGSILLLSQAWWLFCVCKVLMVLYILLKRPKYSRPSVNTFPANFSSRADERQRFHSMKEMMNKVNSWTRPTFNKEYVMCMFILI